jgi:cytochrome P450
MYGAANLDGTVFPDPETFDLSRNPNNHLGFGHGPHYCLGASLAIMQGEAVLRALAERAPDFDIVAGHGERRRELAFHSVTELRLRLRPAHTGLLV